MTPSYCICLFPLGLGLGMVFWPHTQPNTTTSENVPAAVRGATEMTTVPGIIPTQSLSLLLSPAFFPQVII